MPLLTFGTPAAKGSSSLVTLDKATLSALAEISGDAYWSVSANISTAVIQYRSSAGRQKKTLLFDFGISSPTATVAFSSTARDAFVIQKIILRDFDNGELVLDRSQLSPGSLSVVSALDINFAAVLGSYTNEVTADNPYFYYKLEEPFGNVISDYAANLPALLTLGLGTMDQTGIDGKSIYFDGVSTRIISNSSMNISSPFTMEAWIKCPSGATGGILAHNDLSGNWSPEIYLYSGQIKAYIFNGGGIILSSPLTYDDSQWHHVVLTASVANGAKLYVDGAVVASTGLPGVYEFQSPWVVGYAIQQGVGYLEGNIDEVAFYQSELSAARVLAHYNAGIA